MPHDEQKARALEDAHKAANEARDEVLAEFESILEDERENQEIQDSLRRVGLLTLAEKMQADIDAQKAHKAASNAYRKALTGRETL